jgi:hypothetical protein
VLLLRVLQRLKTGKYYSEPQLRRFQKKHFHGDEGLIKRENGYFKIARKIQGKAQQLTVTKTRKLKVPLLVLEINSDQMYIKT